VTIDPSTALQAGVYQLLTADATLMGLVNAVVDEPAEDEDLDYVVVGSRKLSVPDNVHGGNGRRNSVTVDTWTRARSSIPGDTIGARIVELLDHQHAALDALVVGHQVWKCRWQQSQSLDDPEREIRHRIDLFDIYTAQT
jgi:hypothetical protein